MGVNYTCSSYYTGDHNITCTNHFRVVLNHPEYTKLV